MIKNNVKIMTRSIAAVALLNICAALVLCQKESLCLQNAPKFRIGETNSQKSEGALTYGINSQPVSMVGLLQKLMMEKGTLTKEEIPPKKRWQLLINSQLWEGDILLKSRRRLNKLLQQRLFERGRPLGMPWPDARVPFMFTEEYGMHDQMKVVLAMKEIHDNTCVRFVIRKNETSFLKFYKSDGCSSHVGYQHNEQGVSLSDECLKSHVIILHELLHSLGFWHEHTRYDRDNFIAFNWTSIPEDMICHYGKFKKPQRPSPIEYDYNSVLHIPTTGFSRDSDQPVLKLKFPSYFNAPPTGLSKLDVLRIVELYNCHGRMWQSYEVISFAVSTSNAVNLKLEPRITALPFKGRMAQYEELKEEQPISIFRDLLDLGTVPAITNDISGTPESSSSITIIILQDSKFLFIFKLFSLTISLIYNN